MHLLVITCSCSILIIQHEHIVAVLNLFDHRCLGDITFSIVDLSSFQSYLDAVRSGSHVWIQSQELEKAFQREGGKPQVAKGREGPWGRAHRISLRVSSKKDTSGDTCRLHFRCIIYKYMMAINESMDKIASKLSFGGALIVASQEYCRCWFATDMVTYWSFEAPPLRRRCRGMIR